MKKRIFCVFCVFIKIDPATIIVQKKVKRCGRKHVQICWHWRVKGALEYQKWLSCSFQAFFTALGPRWHAGLKALSGHAGRLSSPSFNSRFNAFNLVCVVLGEICNRPETAALCFCSFFDVCWIWPWSLHFFFFFSALPPLAAPTSAQTGLIQLHQKWVHITDFRPSLILNYFFLKIEFAWGTKWGWFRVGLRFFRVGNWGLDSGLESSKSTKIQIT